MQPDEEPHGGILRVPGIGLRHNKDNQGGFGYSLSLEKHAPLPRYSSMLPKAPVVACYRTIRSRTMAWVLEEAVIFSRVMPEIGRRVWHGTALQWHGTAL